MKESSGSNRDRHIVILFCILLVIMAISIVINIFLSDQRKNMTGEYKLIFNESIIDINDIKRDDEKAQIDFTEFYMIGMNKEFKVEIKDQDETSIDYKINKGQTREEEVGGMILETDYSITFNLPEDIYYIKLDINLNDVKNHTTLDYRDFRKVDQIN